MKTLLYVLAFVPFVFGSSSFAADANAIKQAVPDLAAAK
jgi:hypothetical protein